VKLCQATRSIAALALAVALPLCAARSKDDQKEKSKSAGQIIDSGSFGVFVKGQRVITETFTVEQRNDVSIVKSELKETVGSDPATQKSELEFTPGGELVRYDWSQSTGGSLTVMPNKEFLIERVVVPPANKTAEQPFLMPTTSLILDNNFFVQREVLAWRYLASDCKPEGGNLKCQQGPAEFGVVVPQDRTSVRIRMELVGKEKVNIHGTERELLRLNLSGEDFRWSLWLDDHDRFKLMRVAIPADDTEVIRD
jgi:hypothetical protein